MAGTAIAAAPSSNAPPTILGQAREGKTLTAGNGGWTASPTSFAYQWQLCDSSGAGCNPISGATARTYTPAAGDVDHALRVAVTATNTDGSATATSGATSVVSSAKAPVNTASPTVSGTPKVGEQVSADPGTWTGGVRSFSYAWQRCDTSGANCSAIPDATAKAYGVGNADTGHTLRVVVTATNLAGSTNANTAPTAAVGGTAPPVAHNHAPSITFVSLRRVGARMYARFRLCDDAPSTVTTIERDLRPGVLAYSRRFAIAGQPCGTHARTWTLAPRFRHAHAYTATLRAVDKSGATSRTVSRTLRFA